MTAIDTYNFEYETTDTDAGERRTFWIRVLSCMFIAAMFMLATNDPSATARWEAVSKEQVSSLSIALESGRSTRQVAFLSMGLWGAITLYVTRRSFRFDSKFLFPLLILIGWAFLSVIWTDDRSFTGKRLILLTCVGTAALAFVRRFKVGDMALLALLGGCIQLIGSICFDLLYATGSYGRSGYRFSGLQHPNHSGITAMLLIFACIYFFDRTKQLRYLAILGVASVIMYLTKSRTSLIAGMLAIGVFGLLRWDRRTIACLAISALGAMGVFFILVSTNLVADDWSSVIHMGREDSQAAAFTGRPFIWSAALEWLGRDYTRLLLGVGYDSFWTPDAATFVSNRIWFRISEGHCAYFDTLLELGVIGVCSYIYLILASLIRYVLLAWRNYSAAYAFAAMIFVFVIVHGLTESTTVDPNFPTFISFTAMTFLAFRSPRMKEIEDEVWE